jgi:hypothetical protein
MLRIRLIDVRNLAAVDMVWLGTRVAVPEKMVSVHFWMGKPNGHPFSRAGIASVYSTIVPIT